MFRSVATSHTLKHVKQLHYKIAQISKSYNKETIMTSNTNYLYKLNYINAPMLSLYLKEINQVKTGNSAK